MSIIIDVRDTFRLKGGTDREEGHILITDLRDKKTPRFVEVMGFFHNPIHCCYNDADATHKTYRSMNHIRCEALRRYLKGWY